MGRTSRRQFGPQQLFSRLGAFTLLAALALFGALAAPLAAHPFLDERLQRLDEQIAADPANVRLYLTRGSALLDEGHAQEALADFDRAAARDATLTVVHLLRAKAHLALGATSTALAELRRFLELEPASAPGWRFAAEAEAEAGALDAADRAFERYFALVADPRPDDYLARAALARRAGRTDDAIRALEAGVARLGPLTSLLALGLEVERERGRAEAALVWADRLAASSPQVERWQLERARLLASLGRLEEARAALATAEQALSERSTARREAPAFRALALEIGQLRTELAAPAGAPENGR